MTVQYYQEVLGAGPIAFLKLLRKWRGGVFKLIYMDFIVFSLLYTIISCIYRIILKDDHKKQFEQVVKYVHKSQSLIPVAFILGFYVSLVFNRFWRHFNTVPWITKIAIMIASHLNNISNPPANGTGDDYRIEKDCEEGRLQRRSIVRYLVASLILTLSRVSVPVKRRFPNIDDIYLKGILLEHEVEIIKATEPFTMQPFLPISWSTAIVMKAGTQGRIKNEAILINMIKEINKFRQSLQELFLLDQVCVPLVYTQVVTLAVYSYFLSCLIGRQFITDPLNSLSTKDYIVPIFTILQFIVYMGWLKLALTLVNPMGEDDEDFDLNCVVDYNFEVGLAIADGQKINQPDLIRDKFFDQRVFELAMELNMKNSKAKPFMGSVYDMKVDSDYDIASLKSVTIGSEKDLWTDRSQNYIDFVRRSNPIGKKNSNASQRPSKRRTYSNSSGISIFRSTSSLKVQDINTSKLEDVAKISPDVDIHNTAEKHPLVVIEEEDQAIGNDIELKPLKKTSVSDTGDAHKDKYHLVVIEEEDQSAGNDAELKSSLPADPEDENNNNPKSEVTEPLLERKSPAEP